jgi:putative transposase
VNIDFAVLDLVRWYNNHLLMELLGYLPPAEYEEAFHSRREVEVLVAVLN